MQGESIGGALFGSGYSLGMVSQDPLQISQGLGLSWIWSHSKQMHRAVVSRSRNCRAADRAFCSAMSFDWLMGMAISYYCLVSVWSIA